MWHSIRGATVKALDEEVRCLALSREDLTRILGDQIEKIRYNNALKWAIDRNPVLNKLTKLQVEKILQNSKNVAYSDRQVVFHAHAKCEKLVTVLEGCLISVRREGSGGASVLLTGFWEDRR